MKQVLNTLDILKTDEEKALCEIPRISEEQNTGKKRKMYLETYGCQMNFSDSEIVTSIMHSNGFDTTSDPAMADVIFVNTCSIRENAETKVRNKLKQFTHLKKKNPLLMVGVLGCMAERLKAKFLEEEKMVDLVIGPDAYRDLPNLIAVADEGENAVNVFLSREETYADINPVRLGGNGVTAYISIMRGCDNMCSFCVVPYTRGRERSRDINSILKEAQDLFDQGYREVTLLGQNVDSYKWEQDGSITGFAKLLEAVALIHPDLRVRFSTSHPKDMTDDVLETIARYENICNYIHLPAQSGSSRILDLMSRGYTREWYIDRIDAIRRIIGPDCGITTDTITGFCSETEEEHQETISLMNYVKYHYAYMFSYSERPNTPAAKKYKDDISDEVKQRRLEEIIKLQGQHSVEWNTRKKGTVQKVLIDGYSKRSEDCFKGRSDDNTTVVFPRGDKKIGEYAMVRITSSSQGSLFGEIIA